ncbi:MAG: hypothetical protein ABII12_09930 [Planctomycetota bacterium]
MPKTTPTISRLAAHTGWVAAMVVTLLCASVWWYTVDDAYITFRYARNLVEGHGAVFNVGQRVEGFSSPLWLGAAAVAESLHLPVEHATKALGLAAMLGAIAWLTRSLRGTAAIANLPLLLLATHAPLIVALVSGLETGVNAVLIVCLLLSCHPAQAKKTPAARLTMLGSLAILCRPENALIVGVQGLYLWSARPRERKALLTAAGVWFATAGAMTLARLLYYGAILPNTAVAKLSADAAAGAAAWPYVWAWLVHYGWLGLLGFPAILSRRTRSVAINGWLLVAAQIVFVFLAGGDWMPLWRFLLPAGAVLVVLGCYGIKAAVLVAEDLRLPRRLDRAMRFSAATICTVALAGALVAQLWHFRHDRWDLHHYRRQLDTLARGPVRFLAEHAGDGDIVVARDIGILGYNTRCRILDVVGLTDRHVAETSGFRRRDRIDRDYIYGCEPAFLLLQSGNDRCEPVPLDAPARALVDDRRFKQYGFRGRWELPGRHFCEIYERNDRSGSQRTAMVELRD